MVLLPIAGWFIMEHATKIGYWGYPHVWFHLHLKTSFSVECELGLQLASPVIHHEWLAETTFFTGG